MFRNVLFDGRSSRVGVWAEETSESGCVEVVFRGCSLPSGSLLNGLEKDTLQETLQSALSGIL